MVAATILKVQEKKTQKGNSYGIVKFSDLSNVFELFIFSDIFETSRDTLVEGNSLMLTLIKNYSDENKNQKRINVKKLISLKELTDKPIKNITFKFKNLNEFKKLKNLSLIGGETNIKILLSENDQIFTFSLKDKRKLNTQLLNTLNLVENVLID